MEKERDNFYKKVLPHYFSATVPFLRLVIFHSLIGGAHCKVLPVLIRLKVLHPVALL